MDKVGSGQGTAVLGLSLVGDQFWVSSMLFPLSLTLFSITLRRKHLSLFHPWPRQPSATIHTTLVAFPISMPLRKPSKSRPVYLSRISFLVDNPFTRRLLLGGLLSMPHPIPHGFPAGMSFFSSSDSLHPWQNSVVTLSDCLSCLTEPNFFTSESLSLLHH